MRYEKSQALLRLAFEMQGSAEGVSLQDIMQTYDVSRRTAERMRDAVREVFPQVEEVSLGDGFKRWRIRSTKGISAIPVHTDELAALHAAAELLRRDARAVQAYMLESVSAKLRSLLRADELRRMEPDYEALIESEGLVLRPGPRPQIDGEILAALREAIKGCEEIELRYLSRFSGLESRQQVRPYGFLYGSSRHYLVAYNTNPEADDFRLFSLSNILDVTRLGAIFERHPGFSLKGYAANSFGVFQEEPVEVVWHISADVADEAREYLFHPSQQFEEQDDGSLILRFRAGGLVEMGWYLFSWGGEIKALEPPELLTKVRQMTRDFVRAHPLRTIKPKRNGTCQRE
ncbi:MAG: WYL domain-containing protein [Caulobacter sp.]|nr:WYL domain-containing protein [Caulobacter sp.]